MTPHFDSIIKNTNNTLFLEASNDIKQQLQTATQTDAQSVEDSPNMEALQALKELNEKLNTVIQEKEKMKKTIEALATATKRGHKVASGSGLGKKISQASNVGMIGGGGITGKALYDVYNSIQVAIQEYQQYYNQIKSALDSNIGESANALVSKAGSSLKSAFNNLFNDGSDDVFGGVDVMKQASSEQLQQFDWEQIYSALESGKIGIYLLGISYAAKYIGKLISWIEKKWNTSRMSSDVNAISRSEN